MNDQRGHSFTAAQGANGPGGLRPAGEARTERDTPLAERDRERSPERDRERSPERPRSNVVAIAALVVGVLALVVLVLSLGTLSRFPSSSESPPSCSA